MKKIISIALVVFMIACLFTGCGTVKADYETAAAFETALNNGEDLTGKTVTFTVNEVKPNSAFGYNLQAGEHLNFCSTENPGVKAGDTVTVKVTDIQSMLGSYIIYYKLLNKTEGTGVSQQTATETLLEETTVETTEPTNEETTEVATEVAIEVDYSNVEDFEAALNAGEDLTGKIVTITVDTFVPNSTLGYNIQTGEHLNFCSVTHPGVKEGDVLTVRVTEIESTLGSYIIYYEILEKPTEDTTETVSSGAVDYPNVEDFEAALNAGEDLTGKTVTITVVAYKPDSAFGPDIWAGEHLNFISEDDPGVHEGDVITVRITSVASSLGSWFLTYEMI